MSLEDFKTIYWWEWGHRFLGRLIGLAFAVPFAWFLIRRTVPGKDIPRLTLLLVLGGAQGALGWYMVMSGLVDRVDVSQYRLTAHLGLAFIIYGLMFWTALNYLERGGGALAQSTGRLTQLAFLFVGLVYIQILLGGFVAGLRAGHTYNTWPLMDGRFVPETYGALSPWIVNWFENIAAVQFNHRLFAYMVAGVAVWLWWAARLAGPRVRRLADGVLLVTACQVLLGVWTLVAAVPLWLGAAHQAGAVVVFSIAIWLAHRAWAERIGLH